MTKISACGGPLFYRFTRGNGPPQAENLGILRSKIQILQGRMARRRRKILAFGDPKIPILQGEIGILEVENSSPQAEIFVILRSKIQILQGRIVRRRRKILTFGILNTDFARGNRYFGGGE